MALYFCWTVLILFMSTGCQQRNKARRASIKGIKIADLASDYAEPLPKQVQFDIVTFEMPAENYPEIENAFAALPDLGITYNNKKMFKINGFRAAKGTQDMWPELARSLRRSRARKALTSKLTTFDTMSDHINVNIINKPIMPFYIDVDNHDTSILLQPGTIALKVSTLVPKQGSGSALFNITAMHKKHGSTSPLQANNKKLTNETTFDFTNLRLKLDVGDFLLLGCREYSKERLEVKNLLFNFMGDYPMPVKNTANLVNDLGFHLQPNVPLVRLYMFVCTRIDN